MNWLAYSLITLVCWGFMGFVTKLAYEYFGWHQVLVVTNIVPFAASLLIYVLIRPPINIHSLGFGYALLAGVASALGMIAFYFAMEGGKTIIVVPITALYPVVTVVLAYLILREEISLVKGVGLMLALVSIVMISME